MSSIPRHNSGGDPSNCDAGAVVSDRSDIEQSTMRRVARHLVPFLMFCYFINFLDRVHVGFAVLQLNDDLKLNTAAFGFGAGLFFVVYFSFEVPSNMMRCNSGARPRSGRF